MNLILDLHGVVNDEIFTVMFNSPLIKLNHFDGLVKVLANLRMGMRAIKR